MKKINLILSLFCVTLLFTSCIAVESPEPATDLIGTQVAIILTETAINQPQSPTETLAPVETQPESEPTIEMSPSPTSTSTLSPTEIVDEDDPAVLLGDAAWITDFNGSSSPWDFSSEQAVFKTSDGTLNLTAKNNANWHSWYLSSPKLKNAYLEASLVMPNCSGMDRFGLAFRGGGTNWDQFYFMGLTCDGQWGFFRMEPGVKIQTILGYQSAEPLGDGMNNPHRVGV